MQSTSKILIVAGEASGDLLGAHLAQALLQQQPQIELIGMGGLRMKQAGVRLLVDIQSLAIMGFINILRQWRPIRQALQTLTQALATEQPNLVILIDYAGFNLRLAKLAKAAHIRVLYYVSPKIWAWNYRRIYKIKQVIDHMAVLFPFEEAIYQQENIPVTFVGHPLANQVKPTQDPASLYQQYQLDPNAPIIVSLPGSRQQEIKRLLPVMVETSRYIRQYHSNAQFVLALAANLELANIEHYLDSTIRVIKDDLYNVLSISSAAMVTSGTATLEVALAAVPMVIVYKASWLNYQIAKRVAQVDKIGLCNLLAGRHLVKELIQAQANSYNIGNEILHILNDANYRQYLTDNLSQTKVWLTGENPEGAIQVAALALKVAS